MGLLDTLKNLQESYSKHQSKKREEAGLPQLRYKEGKEPIWVKERRIKETLPLELSPETEVKILYQLNEEARKKIDRYREVFRNSPKMLEIYVDKLISASNPEELKEANEFVKDRKNVNLYADKKDFTKWSDLSFYGDQRWDMIYRPESKSGKKAFRKYRSNPVVQLGTGISVGAYNALAGTAELAAAL